MHLESSRFQEDKFDFICSCGSLVIKAMATFIASAQRDLSEGKIKCHKLNYQSLKHTTLTLERELLSSVGPYTDDCEIFA